MTQELVIAATFGRRDLQMLALGRDGLYRVSPAQGSVRDFHQALLDARDSGTLFQFVPLETVRREVIEEDVSFAWRDSRPAFESRECHERDLRPATATEVGAGDPSGGEMLIVAGLLSAEVARLRRELSEGQVVLRQFLLFYTERDADLPRFGRAEPIAAAVLCDWLCRYLPGEWQDDTFVPVKYLEGREELYAVDEARNQHLLPAAAKRIDDAVKTAAARFPGANIRLHDSGGIPQVTPVLQAAARFRFQNRVEYRPPSESRVFATPPLHPSSVPAVEALEARRRTCDLIRRGEFQAAAELTREFTTSVPASAWVRCVAAVARYFQGYVEDARDRTAKLSEGPTRRCLQAILDPAQPQSLHVALRAEAALASDDVLSAASLTVTFLDVAEYDAIHRTLSKDPSQPCMDRASRQIDRSRFLPSETQIRRAAGKVRTDAPWIRGFDAKDLNDWVRRPVFRVIQPWQEFAVFTLIQSVGKQPELARALMELLDSLHRETNTGNVPADFRNIKDHSVMTDAEIRLMIQLFESHHISLWWRRTGEPRSCLHPNARPAAVLAALGVPNARQLFGDLVEALVADVHSSPLV